MSDAQQLPSFVESIITDKVVVHCEVEAARDFLRQLGGTRSVLSPSTWSILYASENELAHLLTALRDAEFAMGGAAGGWPPAAVFEDLRERGKVRGTYTEIIWRGPNLPLLSER